MDPSRIATAFLVLGLSVPGRTGLAGAAPAEGAPIAPFHDVNITRMAGNQSESAVAIDEAAPDHIVAVSNTEGSSYGLAHAWTVDGGRTWQADVIADGDLLGFACCDGSLASDEYGNVFLAYIDDVALEVKVAISTDGGATFAPVASVGKAGPAPPGASGGKLPPGFRPGQPLPPGDQPTVTAGEGSVWVCWTDFGTNDVEASGASVIGLGQVGRFGIPQFAQGHRTGDYGDIAVGPRGQVMIVYQDPTDGEGPTGIYTDLDPDGLGSQGFQASNQVATTNVGGFDYIPAQSGRSVDAEPGLAWDRSGGPHRGRLYLMYTSEEPQESDDLDVQLELSDDGGRTWSPPHRVNRDRGTNSQFLPKMALDEASGDLAITWYDCRGDPGTGGPGDTDGLPNDDAVVSGTVSGSGGTRFLPNVRIGGGASNAADAASGVDYGDYEGLAFFGKVLFPVWADNSNSTGDNPDGTLHQFDLYTARMSVG